MKSAATLLRAQAVQNAQGGGGSAAGAGANVKASDLKNLNSRALNSKYETATKVFKAASAAYKAADATWKDLEVLSFACFTGTKVQLLTACCASRRRRRRRVRQQSLLRERWSK